MTTGPEIGASAACVYRTRTATDDRMFSLHPPPLVLPFKCSVFPRRARRPSSRKAWLCTRVDPTRLCCPAGRAWRPSTSLTGYRYSLTPAGITITPPVRSQAGCSAANVPSAHQANVLANSPASCQLFCKEAPRSLEQQLQEHRYVHRWPRFIRTQRSGSVPR